MSCFYVRPVGFPESEYALLEAILTLGRRALRDDWRWIAAGSADVYLVAVESPSQWQRYQTEFPPNRLVACAPPDLKLDARWQVKRDREHPPSLRELTQVLNDLAAGLGGGKVPEVPASPEPVATVPREPVSPGFIPKAADALTGSNDPPPPRPVSPGLGKSPAEPVPAPVPSTGTAAPKPAAARAESKDSMSTADGAEVYDPEQYLIGIVREALADGVPRRLTGADGDDTVLIEPERGLYFVPGDRVSPWPILSAPRARIEARRLTQTELARAVAAIDTQGLALADLLFMSALAGSRGRLWVGCRADEPVRLRQWPNLRPLPNYAEYVNLAAFMSSNTADVRTIAAQTSAELEKVVDFHNACAALDLLEWGGAVSIRQKPVSAGVRELYQKIAKRLHGET